MSNKKRVSLSYSNCKYAFFIPKYDPSNNEIIRNRDKSYCYSRRCLFIRQFGKNSFSKYASVRFYPYPKIGSDVFSYIRMRNEQ